ncbi:hypothetical protein KAX06_04835 [candidate division WOR-3 bacterium]|nr:hypothetical protein [candidate division WOR-3 bacterium]
MPINDKDLKEQAELTERLGRHASYQLRAQPGRKVKVRNEDNYKKVSSYVTRDGRITFSKPGQAVDVMKSLGVTISFSLDGGRTKNEPAKAKKGGVPRGDHPVGVWIGFDIHSTNPADRKTARVWLRKCLWHEMIETALLVVNDQVFGNPEGVILPSDAFAHQYAKKIDSSTYDYSFWPWAGDAAPPQDKKTQKVRPVHWEVSDCCPGEIFITYESFPKSFKARILDYRFRLVKELSGSPGDGSIALPPNLEPGTYWVEAVNEGSRITRREAKVLLKKPILWEIELREESKTKPYQNYFKIRPTSGSQWPIGKGFGFSLYYHQSVKDRLGRHQLGYVNAGIGKTATLDLKLASNNDRPIKPDQSYTVWAYVQDPYLDDLLVDDHGGARAGVYIRWARHYIAKK